MSTKGHSTIIEVGNAATVAASTAWTKFAKVTEITPPKVEAEDIDVSHMESEEQYEEFDPGWANAGEVECTIQFEKTENETVYGLFRQPKGFRMTFKDGSKWEWNGYIKSFGNEVDRKGIITTPITIKVSGKPVYTKATTAAAA